MHCFFADVDGHGRALLLQFVHVQHFPEMTCAGCAHSFCFMCGEDSHVGAACEAHMAALIASKRAAVEDDAATNEPPRKRTRRSREYVVTPVAQLRRNAAGNNAALLMLNFKILQAREPSHRQAVVILGRWSLAVSHL
jgi:hypothetical protein